MSRDNQLGSGRALGRGFFLSDRVVARLGMLEAAENPAPDDLDISPPTEVGLSLGEAIIGGRFRVGEKLSQGGMGAVYRAIDLSSGEEVALKIPHVVADLRNDARFELESRALATLAASGLVGYVGHGSGAEPFLAMPLVQGEPLSKRLVRGALPERDALGLVRRVTSGLLALHLSGWVHRDIKPANIVVGRDGTAKLVDLGLAREIDGAGSGTKTGDLVGTLSYMAPEQLTGARVVDKRADVFALGCVLFEALTGRNAFRRTTAQIAARLLGREPPEQRPDARGEGVREPLAALIDAMLSPEPPARPADALEVYVRLVTLDPHLQASRIEEASADLDALRRALAHLLHANASVASDSFASATRLALGAAEILTEMLAPSVAITLQGDPAFTSVPGVHADALAACVTTLGMRQLASKLSLRATAVRSSRRGRPADPASVVLHVDAADWIDEESVEVLSRLAAEGVLRVVATSVESSPFGAFGEIAAAPRGGARAPVLGQLSTFERWVARAAAMFGRRFTTAGVEALVAGPEKDLVGRALEALSRRGFVGRAHKQAPWTFRSVELLAELRGAMRGSDVRVGERLARDHRGASGSRADLSA
ncbi:MAG: serine/threonine-protein kinase [Polyangiaceae bacterium]